MPRKTTPRTQEWIEDFQPTEDEQNLQEFLDGLSGEASSIEIYRGLKDGSRENLERVGFDLMREDPYGYLRSEWGPGKYYLIFKSGHQYKAHKTLIVGGKPNGQTTTGNQPAVNTTMETVYRDLMIQNQNLLTGLIGSLKPIAPPPPPDVAAMMSAMMTGIAAMMTAVQSGNPKDPPSAMLKTMVEAFSALKPVASEDPIDKAAKLVEVARALLPEQSEPTFWGVVKDVGKEVVNRLGTMPANAQAPQTVTVETQQVSSLPARPPETPGASFQGYVKIALTYLKEKARLMKDPEQFIDLILSNPEEPHWNAILSAIDRGATFENLLQFDPTIAENASIQAWFKTLYDGISTELRKQVDTAGTGRDDSNTGGDEKAGLGGSEPSGDKAAG